MPEQKALLTVGDVLDALKGFPRNMPIRLAINEDQTNESGDHAYQLTANVHEWGLLHNDIWSNGWATHRCVNLSILSGDERVHHEPNKKFFVNKDKDDPDGEKDYF